MFKFFQNALQTIATVCMFLAGKVEETPRPLKDVILVSYEIIHKKDPAAIQRIKQKVPFSLLSLYPLLSVADIATA
ncbi:Cyclin-t1-5 like [Thalictrum thalictroides]|uniref:Cyclin-t1-5 like n=1 Tax=Thalictrum thalictroides TaxID=46969 RepID=A0A7J6V2R0_THATH|nr:Cyclin-t1-5 like [Thalictrum thalictroides]